ncbi:SusC/RagA family TonB-linked outer membrane protein [Winogradskyella echinorum]|uniref:SusC/RagA family TonB-linked outer membrane protein n=1 Tax=Winogradskyella echinorum TaxID=538189 RepID=A0ABR6Y5W0_9FLAO|nr:SusC/RagA family TonB-linked outer membrane protein [Winogradskyella echinorum]MBC3847625.1 SusC/RagA family TonB-linked outer membrane protein [Winogradskyella echinorum]MBC5751973.1 SusC/RagA family TonB-linked outer membrane protein [Winogradskyella echinorum]
MKTKFKVILTLFLACFVQLSFAQEKAISGTITDASGLPIPGVSVLIKGTQTGTQTDLDGKYSINASVGSVIVVSYLGLKTQEITVGNSSTYNFTMEEDTSLLDEVVVVAYGTTTKEAFTGSASVVGAKQLETRNVTSPIEGIEGRATGIQFTSPAGPGDSPGIVIRGVGTLNGSTTPLYIVDGVQYNAPINTLNQEDIASFTILKDAASTSLYGSRAANGVVIITTKTGKKNEMKVTAGASSGFVSRGRPLYDAVSPGQYYELMWEALRNSSAGGGDPQFASDNIYNQLGYNPFNVPNDQIVGTDGRLNPNADVIYKSLNWFDELERTGTRNNYNVNVSAGGEKHSVFFSVSYLDEESYVITSDFDRLTARLNGEFQVSNRIKIGGSINMALTNANAPSSAGSGSIVNPFSFAQGIGSIYPVFVNDLNGNIVRDEVGNRVWDNGEGFAEYNIGSRPVNQGRHAIQELRLNRELNENNTYGFRMFGELNILEGLNFRLNYGRDMTDFFSSEYENPVIGDAQPVGRLDQRRARRDTETFTQTLSYIKSFGNNHNIDVTAGHESYETKINDLDGLATIQAASGIYEFANFSNIVDLDGATFDRALESYFFRALYNYDNKYYLNASVRTDGSSVFQTDVRWGTFYAIGASWRIDQEEFMQNISWIDQLKIRASYGEIGNDQLNDSYLSQARFNITSNAAEPAILFTDIGNADLLWETSESFDVALEFGLFDNFIDGSIEYYQRNSTDLLYNLPIAPSNGLNVVPVNAGDLRNSGWEFGITAHLFNESDFKWDLTLLGSTLKNEITSLPDPFINGSKRWAEGRSAFDFFLYRTAGVDPDTGDQLYYMYEFNDDNESVPVLDATTGEHLTTNDWTDTERAYTEESSVPDFIGSVASTVNYKNFTFDFLITYGIGGSALDNAYAGMMHSGTYGRSMHPDALNAWRQPGDITDVPRLENGNVALVQTQSDRFLTDASYWNLRNVSLSYRFGDKITDHIGLDNLAVNITGENLIFKSKRDGLDPQGNLAGLGQGNNFLAPKIVSLGLNLSF